MSKFDTVSRTLPHESNVSLQWGLTEKWCILQNKYRVLAATKHVCNSTHLNTCQHHHSKQVTPQQCIARITKPKHTSKPTNKASCKLSRGRTGGAATMGIKGSTCFGLIFVYSHAAQQIQLSLQYQFSCSSVAFTLPLQSWEKCYVYFWLHMLITSAIS